MIIFSNQKSAGIARSVAKETGAALGQIEKKVFPDGEIYIRLMTPVKGSDCVLISSTQTNDDVIELLLTLSAIKENGAKKIICVMPHMAYQRQDHAFKEGEAVSARIFLDMIKTYADKIIVIDAHFLEDIGDMDFMGIPVMNLDAFPLLGKYFAEKKGAENLIIFSPDAGSKAYADAAGKAVGCPSDHLIKKRIDGETVQMQPKELCVDGKDAVILDDIIATGGTMKKAAEMLISQGAKSVSMGCVHGVFAKGTDIFGDFEVVSTDSILGELSKVHVAPLIAKELLS